MSRVAFPFLSLLLACLLLQKESTAQCTGNVLFYENFGGGITSPIPGPSLPPGITTYRFDSLGVINDGEYGIRKTTADIATGQPHFPSWHIGNDHSGGYMMMINADLTAGKFYETKVNNLCSGSQLYFSAWVANLLKLGSNDPLDPVLKFEISSAATGAVLASFITPSIPRYSSFTWTQYGFNFSLPSGENDVVLKIYNNQPGGQGNDLCLDDIEFTLCGPAITPVVNGTYQSSNDACIGSNISFTGNVAPGFYSNTAYQWQYNNGTTWTNIPGATSANYTLTNAQPVNTGSYRLLVAESANINSVNCRAVSPIIPLTIYNPVIPVLQSNQPICEKDTIRISTSTTALQYLWKKGATALNSTGNSLTIANSSVADAGIYSLDIITNGGCSSSASIPVTVQQNLLQRKIPNNTILCDAQTLAIDAQQATALSYLWNDGTTSPQRTLSTEGMYWIKTTEAVCKRTDTILIARSFSPTVTLGKDTTLCYNEIIILNAFHPLAQTYLWSTNSTDSSIAVQTAGIYSVEVTNTCGTATDAMQISYEDCADIIFVPNAFTPNDDNLNDVLKPKAFFRIDEISFKIFNRWGKEVFSSASLHKGWDGKYNNQQAPPGLYSWTIKYKRNDKLYQQKGSVLLIY
jgi:gliding motility-associated-like protein